MQIVTVTVHNLFRTSLAMLLDSNFRAINNPSPTLVSLKNSTVFLPPSRVKKSLQQQIPKHFLSNAVSFFVKV